MQDITPELLRKYFNGQCTPEEEMRVAEWLGANYADIPVQEVFQGIDKEALKNHIWRQVNPETAPTLSKRKWLPTIKMAASALIILISAYLIYEFKFHAFGDGTVAEAQYQVMETAPGKKLRMTLKDGTLVHLNAGSRLQIPTAFSDTARVIHLHGEAYLEVAPEKARPFMVVTGHTTIHVLGTVFNVHAYPDETVTKVVVSEGKVLFTSREGKSALLTKNQQATYSSLDLEISLENTQAAAYMVWKDNRLVFRDQPLEEIASTLRRWYNVQVEIKDENLKDHHFTGSYHRITLSRLMKDMSKTMRFQYKIKDDKLTIY